MFAERTVPGRQNPRAISGISHRIVQIAMVSSLTLLAIGCGGSSTPRIGTTPQAITFNNPGTQTAGTSQMLSATSKSGLAVTFTSATPSTCTVSGSTASFIAAGTCTLNANIAGNSTYAAATPVAQSFAVNPAIASGTTVYIAGYAFVLPSGDRAATLWQLASGTPTASATLLSSPGGMANSVAQAVAVSGSDVYVAGFAQNATTTSAVLWHNGSPVVLPSSMSLSRAYNIAVSSGNVYVVGFEANSSNASSALLWVNGVATPLPTPSGLTGAIAFAITVSGGNVYIAGTASSSTLGNTAVYWVNGTPTVLPQPSGLAAGVLGTGIGVLNGNVYVCGFTDSASSNETALLWQNNGLATTLPIPPSVLPQNYGAQQITVSGSDVYVAGSGATGSGSSTAAYWLNSVPTILPLPNYLQANQASAYAVQIVLVGSDVYAAGSLSDSADNLRQEAVYWVDGGAATLLPMPTGAGGAYANGIAVATP